MVTEGNVEGGDGATCSDRTFLRAWSACLAFSVFWPRFYTDSHDTLQGLRQGPCDGHHLRLISLGVALSLPWPGAGAGAKGSDVRQVGTERIR